MPAVRDSSAVANDGISAVMISDVIMARGFTDFPY
jgi:hypothetical protein